MTTVEQHTCAICQASETDPGLLADCSRCGALFHLNPRNDIEGIDCGDVWAGDCDQPVLQFFCNSCLARIREEIQAQGVPTSPSSFDPFGAPPGALATTTPPAASPVAAPPVTAPAPNEAAARPRRRFRRIDGP